jgi:hypothetical protein
MGRDQNTTAGHRHAATPDPPHLQRRYRRGRHPSANARQLFRYRDQSRNPWMPSRIVQHPGVRDQVCFNRPENRRLNALGASRPDQRVKTQLNTMINLVYAALRLYGGEDDVRMFHASRRGIPVMGIQDLALLEALNSRNIPCPHTRT